MATSFNHALEAYLAAGNAAVAAHLGYKKAHAEATMAADEKNAEKRAAQADLATLGSRQAYEKAKVAETAARAELDYIVAAASARAVNVNGPHLRVSVGGSQDVGAVAAAVSQVLEGAKS